jgi:hypothetical protein
LAIHSFNLLDLCELSIRNVHRTCLPFLTKGGIMDKLVTLKKLEEKKRGFEERIIHLEEELKKPLKQNDDECAIEEENREVLTMLYKVEKENLLRVNSQINEVRYSPED